MDSLREQMQHKHHGGPHSFAYQKLRKNHAEELEPKNGSIKSNKKKKRNEMSFCWPNLNIMLINNEAILEVILMLYWYIGKT